MRFGPTSRTCIPVQVQQPADPALLMSKSRPRPLRILCADDNTMLGEVMLCLFARAGHWVEHVEDGAQAWERISGDLSNFDVVVTDHQMPGLSGLKLVERLRQARFPGRIIVHSSAVTAEEAKGYRGFGVDGIVLKASQADELISAVEGLR